MSDPNFILLYVKHPADSAAFYQRLLGKPPVEAASTFAMFALDSGVKLGLWGVDGVLPAASLAVGGGELAFAVDGVPAVAARYAAWRELGVVIAQEPVDMDFGHTFVALDPDGHRLRVFAPAPQ